MNAYENLGSQPSVRFTGDWKEFAPIAITNFLLMLVTLGIYRFWAVARTRRYLWSKTEVAGDPLEWSGTGKEMFIGFALIFAVVLLPFYLLSQWVVPGLLARGQDFLAGLIGIVLYVGLIYLGGFALFRALRYRLSRTWWRGIRGGSEEPGWNYAGEALVYTFLTFITLGLAYPHTQAKLWNSRWNSMSFGSFRFEADLQSGPLYPRWLALYALPILLIVLGAIGVGIGAAMSSTAESAGMLGLLGLLFVFAYLVIPLAMMAYYAKFYREAASATQLEDVQIFFDARTWGWIKLWLGNIALALVTLGVGALFWAYRNWKFVVTHLELEGTIDMEEMAQSDTNVPTEAEGLADAFDIGAF